MKYDILNLSKIFEDFIDKHKEIDEIGRGMWYDEEPERKPTVKKLLVAKKHKNIYAIDGGAALHIKNESIFKSISFKLNKNAYEVSIDQKNIIEKSFRKVILN